MNDPLTAVPTAPLAVTWRRSPNANARRPWRSDGGTEPDLIILHYTGMESGEAALERLCDPAAEVSAHYVIETDGDVLQLVEETDRAWHAGRAIWQEVEDINSRSIGVEIVNPGHDGGLPPFPMAQMDAVSRLIGDLRGRWRIPPTGVLGHSDIAPERKADPGEAFDWGRLARSGHVLAPPPGMAHSDDVRPSAETEAAFRDCLLRAGYGPWPTAPLLTAFRRRYRPSAVSACPPAPDGVDLALARWLSRALGKESKNGALQ